MQYSGVVLIAVMSVAMILALRIKWLERYLDGLDKMYRLHKWLGISALIIGVMHWWWGKFTKWMVGWGCLTKPSSVGGMGPGDGSGQLFPVLQDWVMSQRALAETVGEWGFYVAVILIALALIKRFPYHLFISTHKILAITYLLFVYHSLILMHFFYWSDVISWFVLFLMLLGSYAAVVTLFKKIGANRKVPGHITEIDYFPSLQMLEISIELTDGWPGHKAGQFAFVRSSKQERAHPYTISSGWTPSKPQINMIIKELGDHTSRLPKQLTVGTPVSVEGPYGCFTFEDTQPRQIWIGAGIGITPFIARLQSLATTPDGKEITLFHPTVGYDEEAISKLNAHAAAAGVTLHLVLNDRDPLLTRERICELVPEWRSASIWFCGPAGFGQSLREDFKAQGLASQHFHQELFEMR
ncbi:MAG: ferric reductase [Alcaligenaceae bacterium]|jgi:predicted ferric reductase|nr:ferric reductase [Alcaligenaceae bacterium]